MVLPARLLLCAARDPKSTLLRGGHGKLREIGRCPRIDLKWLAQLVNEQLINAQNGRMVMEHTKRVRNALRYLLHAMVAYPHGVVARAVRTLWGALNPAPCDALGLAAGCGRIRGEVRETFEPPLAPAACRATEDGAVEEGGRKTQGDIASRRIPPGNT